MLIYLDNSATTRQYDEVTRVMKEAMEENFGNPSSLHALGLKSEKLVRESRKTIAKTMGAAEEEIIFTSGGTESDNTALYGIAHARKREGKKITVNAAVSGDVERETVENYIIVIDIMMNKPFLANMF